MSSDPFASPGGAYEPQPSAQPAEPLQSAPTSQPAPQAATPPPAAQPLQYGAPMSAPSATKPKTWMNIAALVCSLVGISLAGIILGHLGVRAADRGEADNRGLGLAGLIIGYIGIALTLIVIIAIIALAASSTTVSVN